ncbi:hypothetical protein KDU71_20025 [Carboxylicivirga sediminis]|uniref:Outer membrane protein beta-barrel domain-containing protein n=1 Tax=Carboxylicivirga sediminis TaxID=2006564 RepID=A0A941IZH6_9BACT|nr:outer membrane beta-barrel protein [Carboxylicivirga sediminis]MBR8537870.1 hypothetical protein [Carboxylicivirga sediminis]
MKQLLIVALALLSVNAMAQHDHHAGHETHSSHETSSHGKHKLSLYTGFTHIPSAFYEHETHEESTGKWVPTIGVDYYYSLNNKWALGLIGDVELDQYYITTSNHDELERNNVVVVSAVGKYKPTHRIGILAGPGVEWEFKNHDTETFFVLKTGIEYEVEIENGWELTPMFTYDFKEEYSAYSFGITIGKRF